MNEPPIPLVPGTHDWLPGDFALIASLEQALLDCFARAGYTPLRTPVLEWSELHERKSGAGIVAKLVHLDDVRGGAMCLRPELTASIVRAYVAADVPPELPWRVSSAGPVFRDEALRPGVAREFTQAGVELLGAGGAAADAEVIALADRALHLTGVGSRGSTIRLGHLGLVLEVLARSGLPAGAQAALVEVLSEAAAEGNSVEALEAALDRLTAWLASDDELTGEILPSVTDSADRGVDRLFRELVPDVTGRRSGHEIVRRMRHKWELGHSLRGVVDRLRVPLRMLGGLRGPVDEVLARLRRDFQTLVPEALASLEELTGWLSVFGVSSERLQLDLGFRRGIGFHSQMIFAIDAPGPSGPIEVCGGGRYDGLARVLGSDRDARGAGFAFGLERLASAVRAGALAQARPGAGAGGFVARASAPEWREETARLARAMWDEGRCAVLALDHTAEAALALARQHRCGHVVDVMGPLERDDSLRAIAAEGLEPASDSVLRSLVASVRARRGSP